MRELPRGWVETTLGEVVSYASNQKAEPNEIPNSAWILELEDIEKDTSKLISTYRRKDRDVKSTKNTFIKGDVLYGKLRPYLNKILIAKEHGFCSTEIIPITPPQGIDNRYLFYSMKRPTFIKYVSENAHGMNMPRLGTSAGKLAPFILAPAPEQKRIADKLDALLAKVDSCKARLDRVPGVIKRFRQSVLTVAVSGRLTEVWRRGKKLPHKHAGNLFKFLRLPEIPKTWQWVSIVDLVLKEKHALKAGPFGSSLKKDMYVPKGYKIYGQEQVISGDAFLGNYYINKTKYNELENCKIKPGDVLISLVGTVGKVLILPQNCQEGIINPRLIKISFDASIYLPQFFKIYFTSELLKSFYSELIHGSTMDVLNLGIIKDLPYPLPPLPEQTEIVRRVESLFSLADELERKYTTALQNVNNLTSSILSKAFRGELVPQDPDDETAEMLLERIKIERENMKKPTSGKSIRPKAQNIFVKGIPSEEAFGLPSIAHGKPILEILKSSHSPISAKDLWQQSIHADDIESFYAELKKIENQIIEIKEGVTSKLRLKK